MNFARVLGLVQSAVCSRDARADETFDLWGYLSRCEMPRVYQFWLVVYNRCSRICVKRTNRQRGVDRDRLSTPAEHRE